MKAKDMLEKLKGYWKILNEGYLGYLTYAIIGIILAYLLNYSLGKILKTELPLVVVVSSSMSHYPQMSILCGSIVKDSVKKFEDYWKYCENTYKDFNITKEKFLNFPFKNGLDVGDVAVVMGSEKYNVGDIIVYKPQNSKYPIIHRVVEVDDGFLQTKGDNNLGQLPYEKKVELSQIYGRVILRIPLIGWPRVLVLRLIGI